MYTDGLTKSCNIGNLMIFDPVTFSIIFKTKDVINVVQNQNQVYNDVILEEINPFSVQKFNY